MSYRITWRCDWPGCPRLEVVRRPEPSAMVSQHLPARWGMERIGPPNTLYDVYCPDHVQEHDKPEVDHVQ